MSRSPEEAARDPEWPGPPLNKLTQAILVCVPPKPPTSKPTNQTDPPPDSESPTSPSLRIRYLKHANGVK